MVLEYLDHIHKKINIGTDLTSVKNGVKWIITLNVKKNISIKWMALEKTQIWA